jgi:hypothetical protein
MAREGTGKGAVAFEEEGVAMLELLKGALFLGAIMLYLIPSIEADACQHNDAFTITLVNVLLGWTVIGWVAAFMWARRPLSKRRLKRVARKGRLARARTTIGKIVADAKRRSLAAATHRKGSNVPHASQWL